MAAVPGHVTIVGGGPGPAEHITLAVAKALREADVCLHDRMVGKDVLEMLRKDASVVDVGKGWGKPGAVMQMACNAIMTREAAQGKHVVRLHTGDPSIYGRMEEELRHLALNKIPYKILPGVTAASAASAASHIPLTTRTSPNILITSGQRPSIPTMAAVLKDRGTVVSYMSSKYLPSILQQLVADGVKGTVPLAIVSDASRSTESTKISTVASLLKEGHQPDEKQSLCILGEATGVPETLKKLRDHEPFDDGPVWDEPSGCKK
eukprot:TRINITY_DN3_c2_g1_i1.p1 TRINITY_DN3_c2_g1~~TRINITY_DN3_c2_g1_i1.p1  ORF type:complete len:264 (+),score=43.51 TRINITY_DN3_c2_g1_i1:114-905(+)